MLSVPSGKLTTQQVTQQAMSYAIRSGIAITSTYALKQCGRLMKVSLTILWKFNFIFLHLVSISCESA
jgi:hypothetical protein